MIVTLSHQQMLQTWRKCAGLEPSVIACSIERFDGIDVNSRLEAMMRQWYLALLDGGDPALLGAPAEASELLSVGGRHADGSAEIVCSPSVRLLCSVMLSGWERPAGIIDAGNASRETSLLANPFSRPGAASPLAWRDSSGCIFAAPAYAGGSIISAKAYIDNGPETYRLDERALATIPTSIQIFA